MPMMPAMMPAVPAMVTAMMEAMPTMVTAVTAVTVRFSKRRRDSDEGHQGYNRQDLLEHRVSSAWFFVLDELSRLIFRRST
jgi:hypothetical protein